MPSHPWLKSVSYVRLHLKVHRKDSVYLTSGQSQNTKGLHLYALLISDVQRQEVHLPRVLLGQLLQLCSLAGRPASCQHCASCLHRLPGVLLANAPGRTIDQPDWIRGH